MQSWKVRKERGICSHRRPLINAMNRITILKYILEYYNLCQREVATGNPQDFLESSSYIVSDGNITITS